MSNKKSKEEVLKEISIFIYGKYEFIDYLGAKEVIIKDEYGKLKVATSDIKKKYTFGINSAIDSKSYATNKIKQKFPNINLVYIPQKVKGHNKIIINDGYGDLEYSYNDLIVNKNTVFNIKSAINKTEYFINKAKEVHGDKYDYSLVEYNYTKSKVKIICKKHGVFEQSPFHHIKSNSGCFKCGNEKTAINMRNHPNGWNKTNWIKANNKNQNYKLYFIKCCNENEQFYKIGRTFNTLEKRFGKTTPNKLLPYSIEKIFILEDKDACLIYDLETKFKSTFKNYKYLPKIKFDGMNECFKIPEVEKAKYEFDGHTSQDSIERMLNLIK
jgi:hypothetical protein